MPKPPRRTSGGCAAVAEAAKATAERVALSVTWRQLADEVGRYVGWHEFALWLRNIEEAGGWSPVVLQALEHHCPGFLSERRSPPDPHDLFWIELIGWIHTHYFAEAKDGAWLPAVTYYAERDPAARGAWRHWERISKEWQSAPPARFPSLQHWRNAARQSAKAEHPVFQWLTSEAPACSIDRLLERNGSGRRDLNSGPLAPQAGLRNSLKYLTFNHL
jgi:hypothetical protein